MNRKEKFIKKSNKVHNGKYDYSKVDYVDSLTKVCIICPQHGEFWQTPSKHLLGQECPKCAVESRSKLKILTNDEFKERSSIIHNGKYIYDKTIYVGTYVPITITCPIHGDFLQRANDHLNGHGCPHCGNNISTMEDEICEYLEEIGVTYERNNRTILDGSEIDILVQEKSFGIECNGLKWHSEEFKSNDYHLTKTNECTKKGIRLFHIYEDEWLNKKDIIKDKIASALGKINNKIYARNCTIGIPSEEEKRKFINKTHIQGDIPCSVKIGLYYQNELVAVMTFGNYACLLDIKTLVETNTSCLDIQQDLIQVL